MADTRRLSIGEVVRHTGLTERTLRFYEEQGLIRPPRSDGGRREYGAAELKTLHRIAVLKRVGFSLSQIKRLLSESRFSDDEILDGQIAELEAERSVIERALSTLANARAAATTRELLDAESLCELILLGERKMKHDTLNEYIDKHYTPEQQQRWKEAKLDAAGGDWDGYAEEWNDLMRRIEQSLPLDPASDQAQAYLAEWKALLEPFSNALDDEMKTQAVAAMSIDNPELEPFVSRQLSEFIEAARRASEA